MNDRYEDMSKRLDESLRFLKQMKEELKKRYFRTAKR